jgi:hypothetical protein
MIFWTRWWTTRSRGRNVWRVVLKVAERIFASRKRSQPSLGESADVVRRGWLRPPVVSSQALPPRKPVAPLADLLRELDEDRRDR